LKTIVQTNASTSSFRFPDRRAHPRAWPNPRAWANPRSFPRACSAKTSPKACAGSCVISEAVGSSRPATRRGLGLRRRDGLLPFHRRAQVGNHAMARLSDLFAVGYENLQVAAHTAFVDPHKHVNIICPKIKLNNNYIGNVCDYTNLPTHNR